MATYAEIEREKQTGKNYVIYNYSKMHPDIPDKFITGANWCKYWILAFAEGRPSRLDVYYENLSKHDANSTSNEVSFKDVEKLMIQNGVSAEKIEQFKRIASVNVEGDNRCKLMIYGGATIDFSLLIEDVQKAGKNANEISKIFKALTKQVNAAALNGVISKLYCEANDIGKNAQRPSDADAYVEAKITKLYERLTVGDKFNRPINIPENPQEEFVLTTLLDQQIVDYSKRYKNLSQKQVVSFIESLKLN